VQQGVRNKRGGLYACREDTPGSFITCIQVVRLREFAMIGKERLVKAAVVVAILACQFLPTQLTQARAEDQAGVASVYSNESASGTASGEKLNPEALTAAHRTLPFGSKVRVTKKSNSRSVVVTISDRGPLVRGRIIDVSPAAARALGFSGLTQVILNVSP
jgi:rare lipoprotein A